jgi:hypothetical protein
VLSKRNAFRRVFGFQHRPKVLEPSAYRASAHKRKADVAVHFRRLEQRNADEMVKFGTSQNEVADRHPFGFHELVRGELFVGWFDLWRHGNLAV